MPDGTLNFDVLTLNQAIFVLAIIALIDLVTGIGGALKPPNTFNLKILDIWIITHLVLRVLPLMLIAVLAKGAFGIPASGWTELLFVAGAGVYALTTLQSAYENITQKDPPTPPTTTLA